MKKQEFFQKKKKNSDFVEKKKTLKNLIPLKNHKKIFSFYQRIMKESASQKTVIMI